jgi:hypothetical protein
MEINFEQLIVSGLNTPEVLALSLSNESREIILRSILNTASRLIKPELDPISKHADGTWWFWIQNEIWTDEYGPYPTKEAAAIALKQYGNWLDGNGHFMPPDEYIDQLLKKWDEGTDKEEEG